MESVTAQQISDMCHAIGYRKHRQGKIMHYVYRRNFFAITGINDSWEDLVAKKLAAKRQQFGETVYSVTDKGIKYLSDIYSVEFVGEK